MDEGNETRVRVANDTVEVESSEESLETMFAVLRGTMLYTYRGAYSNQIISSSLSVMHRMSSQREKYEDDAHH
jgi:hypothetical protein